MYIVLINNFYNCICMWFVWYENWILNIWVFFYVDKSNLSMFRVILNNGYIVGNVEEEEEFVYR